MSSEPLLEAVRDTIVSSMGLAVGECDIQPEGHPPATIGDFYISVDEGAVTQSEKGLIIHEVFGVSVYITLRNGIFPKDRLAEAYDRNQGLFLAGRKSLTWLERGVIRAIHGNEQVRILACTKAGISLDAMFAPVLDDRAAAPGGDGSAGDIYQLPLYYSGRSKTEVHDAGWVGSSADKQFFSVRQLSFQGGLRVQSLTNLR